MGERKLRMLAASQLLKVSLDKLHFVYMPNDEIIFGEGSAEAKALRTLFYVVLGTKYPSQQGQGGMDRHARKIWAAWQEALDGAIEDDTPLLELPRGHFEWIAKILSDDDLKLPPAFAQWAEEAISFLEACLQENDLFSQTPTAEEAVTK